MITCCFICNRQWKSRILISIININWYHGILIELPLIIGNQWAQMSHTGQKAHFTKRGCINVSFSDPITSTFCFAQCKCQGKLLLTIPKFPVWGRMIICLGQGFHNCSGIQYTHVQWFISGLVNVGHLAGYIVIQVLLSSGWAGQIPWSLIPISSSYIASCQNGEPGGKAQTNSSHVEKEWRIFLTP